MRFKLMRNIDGGTYLKRIDDPVSKNIQQIRDAFQKESNRKLNEYFAKIGRNEQ